MKAVEVGKRVRYGTEARERDLEVAGKGELGMRSARMAT